MYSELKIPSPNFLVREHDPHDIYLFSSNNNVMTLGGLYTDKESRSSVHYIVSSDGKVIEFIEPESRAMHERDDGYTVVVQLCDVEDFDYSLKQIETLVELTAHLCAINRIPLNHIQGDLPKFPFYEFLNGVGAAIIQKELED